MAGLIEIDKLTPEEKLQLMGGLWELFVDDPDSLPIRDEERQELERRSREHRLNPGSVLSEIEFGKQLGKRLGRSK